MPGAVVQAFDLRLGEPAHAARRAAHPQLALADLGINPEDFSWAKSILLEVAQRPPREAGTVITDDGTAAEQLADYLAANRLI